MGGGGGGQNTPPYPPPPEALKNSYSPLIGIQCSLVSPTYTLLVTDPPSIPPNSHVLPSPPKN